MLSIDTAIIVLAGVALFAAFVNGAIGYGFSSLTVPLALVFASLQPGWVKLGTYTVILPLILIQAAGWRRPVRSTWLIGLPFGTALGILYSVTTISGPPLAILFNNQGLVKSEFRAGLALVR